VKRIRRRLSAFPCVSVRAFLAYELPVSIHPSMSVQIDVVYRGELRCQATHGPSGTQFVTDAPVDNHGKGESFSPTDLVAIALGSCMLTTMAIYAERHQIDLTGSTVTVLKEMTQVPVRRIARLTTEIRMSISKEHPQREALERTAFTCPVHQSLHPDVEKPVTIVWA
jgi:putative redox protein